MSDLVSGRSLHNACEGSTLQMQQENVPFLHIYFLTYTTKQTHCIAGVKLNISCKLYKVAKPLQFQTWFLFGKKLWLKLRDYQISDNIYPLILKELYKT